jgi:hypothetical protein
MRKESFQPFSDKSWFTEAVGVLVGLKKTGKTNTWSRFVRPPIYPKLNCDAISQQIFGSQLEVVFIFMDGVPKL